MTRKTPALLLTLLVILVAMSSIIGCAPNIERLEQKQDVEELIIALDHKNGEVRKDAARALGQIGDSRALEPLIAALKDKDSDVRMAAAKALVGIYRQNSLDEESKKSILAVRDIITSQSEHSDLQLACL